MKKAELPNVLYTRKQQNHWPCLRCHLHTSAELIDFVFGFTATPFTLVTIDN